MKKVLFALTAASLLLFQSCKKDDDDGENTSENPCKVTSAQYLSNGQTVQTATYTYTSNQVTKVQLTDVNYTFEYANNNITKRNYFFSAGANPEVYDQVSYNSDGTVSRIESFGITNSGTYTQFMRIDFTYSGGKLNKMTFSEITGSASEVFLENTYSYTGNNITSLDLIDHRDTTQGTLNYTYDTNPNHLKKQNSQVFMIDLLFNSILNDEGVFLPLAFSENNVTGVSGTSFSYQSDTRQNLTDINVDGKPFIKYTYQCP